jgi:pimeloyl-ACP methyl ester carboxylesterase
MSRPTQRLPAVVFLHGIGGCARLWAPQLSAFAAAGFVPLALDLPGYGSRAPVTVMEFDALAADVEAAIDRGGLERPVLVGHSFGGMVAQASLRRRPHAYRAVILCATSPAFGNRQGDFQQRFVASRLEALDNGRTLAQLAPGLVDGLVGPAPDPAARPQAIAAMSAVHPDTYRAAVSCLVGFDERANLPAISIPVLCLAGQCDRTAPAEMMQRMADKIAGAVYHCLPGVGHLANLEAPAAFNAACLDFLRRTCKAEPV